MSEREGGMWVIVKCFFLTHRKIQKYIQQLMERRLFFDSL